MLKNAAALHYSALFIYNAYCQLIENVYVFTYYFWLNNCRFSKQQAETFNHESTIFSVSFGNSGKEISLATINITACNPLRKDIRNLNETITAFLFLYLFPILGLLCRGELHLEVIIAKR